MKTNTQEYLDLLYQIQDENKRGLAVLLPGAEQVYNIDLNTRSIEAPEYLSIETDHRSEVIYFKCNRYYDAIDLSNTVCIIQYINGLGEGRVYAVPFYDVDTLSETNEMIIPWEIDGEATKAAGNIEYSVRFYLMDSVTTNKHLVYNLNTLPATSKILHGINVDPDEWEKPEHEDFYASYLEQILEVSKKIADKDVYWITI